MRLSRGVAQPGSRRTRPVVSHNRVAFILSGTVELPGSMP